MSEDSDNYELSDIEIDDRRHEKLVTEVLNLSKVQNVKKPSRTEPAINISEYNLVKSVTGNKGSIHLNELARVLVNGRKNHVEISKKFKSTKNKGKILPIPLEKPQAERIRRSLNYEKSRLELDRWEAFVTSNRAASHLSFPLGNSKKVKIEKNDGINQFRLKTDLQKALEKLEPKIDEYHINSESTESFPLTLEELKEKRKEAAKLRVHQSFKEAKARRQNKIKSKKYHRILRREKIKRDLKEFEELQKKNPEEALKKLEDIEKARAEERFNLRHKGTGRWARNKQIRAKYDKESRQVLAQQLSIGRELTQKIKSVDSNSEDEINEEQEYSKADLSTENNPWVNGVKPNKDVIDFVSGYRKYWNEHNKSKSSSEIIEKKDGDCEFRKVIQQNGTSENTGNKKQSSVKNSSTLLNMEKPKTHKNKNSKLNTSLSTSDWDVEEMFDQLEEKLNKKIKTKFDKIKVDKKIKKKRKTKVRKTNKIDLSLPTASKKPIIDEEMIETTRSGGQSKEKNEGVDELKSILNAVVEKETPNINPEKFIEVKKTDLNSAIPDILTTDDNEEANDQKNIIMEAFEDDDIAMDFEKEKAEEIEKDTPKDIDLNLPGWGSWGGTNIDPSKRKRRRFIIKMPQKIPRRDDNKGTLIINEKAQSKIKPHLVSELPFPFKTIKDYEASIRAPIGNTFVTETAFRKFIQPAVVTKMGAIIEPISKGLLIGQKKK